MHNVLTYLGVINDSLAPHGLSFWATPFGMLTSLIIAVCATINVYHPGINDSLFDRVWYSCIAVLMYMATLSGIFSGGYLPNLFQTFMFFVAMHLLYSVVRRHLKWKKTGEQQICQGMDKCKK